MDKILIRDLELFGKHGVLPEERSLGQKFVLDADLYLDLSEAGKEDDLTKTVHYGHLCEEMERVFQERDYQLIEAAASALAEHVLRNHPMVEKITLTLKKPWAPVKMNLAYPAVEITRSWHEAYIALGSNLGDREGQIRQALDLIGASGHTRVVKVSGLQETEPVGYTDQAPFINGAAAIRTLLSPVELVRWLLSVEQELKRVRPVKWGPRTIDLDVIFYDDAVTSLDEIVIPHPRMQERAFVLEPLNELAPFKMHPVLGRRVFELLADLKGQELTA